jgi:hypothetical protein
LIFIELVALVDIEPMVLSTTWYNNRSGEEYIEKQMDIFFVKETIWTISKDITQGFSLMVDLIIL